MDDTEPTHDEAAADDGREGRKRRVEHHEKRTKQSANERSRGQIQGQRTQRGDPFRFGGDGRRSYD